MQVAAVEQAEEHCSTAFSLSALHWSLLVAAVEELAAGVDFSSLLLSVDSALLTLGGCG